MLKRVHSFARLNADVPRQPLEVLGGSGAALAEAAQLGLPVPPGFTVSALTALSLTATGDLPPGVDAEIDTALMELEVRVGQRLGGREYPLVVAVRCSSRVAMPGLPRAVLGVGLNDRTTEALARRSGDAVFAWMLYARFIALYASEVAGLEPGLFDDALEMPRRDPMLTAGALAAEWQRAVAVCQDIYFDEAGELFPQDVHVQLRQALRAQMQAWLSRRLSTYRHIHAIPDAWGCAVTVQKMVFGALGAASGIGKAHSRDPNTGAKLLGGTFMPGAFGDDVDLAGTPTMPISEPRTGWRRGGAEARSVEAAHPGLYAQLCEISERLERTSRDMVQFDFASERGKVFLLNVRPAKRNVNASLRVAIDLSEEGLIDRREALMRIEPTALEQILHPSFDPEVVRAPVTRGIGASPGAACGRVVFTSAEAQRLAASGTSVILVRSETGPEDVAGQHVAAGVLTSRGGMTSHAAVVARGMGKPCVCGASELRIDEAGGFATIGEARVAEADMIAIDGTTGEVMIGEVPTVQPSISGDFATLMEWADRYRVLGVRANADTTRDALAAKNFGAQGIGLCRTEHMFFEGDRIVAMRRMILADTEAGRRAALDDLLPMQRDDFYKLFHIMRGYPVTIRLLDPPLHEFLPKSEADMEDIARHAGTSVDRVRRRVRELGEANPMLGHRGCRLGISYPEIYEMQARAIFLAADEVYMDTDSTVTPEIMIPLVGSARELEILKAVVDRVAAEASQRSGRELVYLVGTMIELPRACLRAHEIAQFAEFFSFGTNDLTQTTYGISRDDAAPFLMAYQRAGVFADDPFSTIDVHGVGRLIRVAVEEGRDARPDLKLGVCGEHGADPRSVRFFEDIGLDYVSCSPYRVPVARLAAAQAALSSKRGR
jgi:pyruvate, orthophosphate dikinase